jgi:NADH:ubiquinone oxidoreductase subunit 5 (subunit L)/multisubunit Na+/H+ antiporter MnhA subunit
MDRKAKGFRWVGRILACLSLAYGVLAISYSTFIGEQSANTFLEPPLYILAILIVALGLLLLWWHDLPARIFLFSISAMVWAIARLSLNGWLILGLPLAVAALLFIVAWLLSLKHGEFKRGVSPSN